MGGAMGLQPHLILRVLHRTLIFTIEVFSCLYISPTWFDYLPQPMYVATVFIVACVLT